MVRIAIIGMGLIGTSLGSALRAVDAKDSHLGAMQIVGYDADARATKAARGRLAIDREANTLAEALRDAQIVVIATPVGAIREIFAQLPTLLPAGAIVTDTASTKAQVNAWAAELLPASIDFIGGHPMAGKEQAGTESADAELFKDAIYCLTPSRATRREALDAVEALVNTVGAKPYYIDPDEHDAYVAGVSHLPFLLSAALIETTSRSPAWKEMTSLAASGFRDVSRLASGDPVMHRDICLTNQAALTRWIDGSVQTLLDVRAMLTAADSDQLDDFFMHAKQTRDAWLDSRPNLRPGEENFEQPVKVERPNLFGLRSLGERRRKP